MSIKHLEVKRAYYADPENVVVQYQMANGNWYDWISEEEPRWDATTYLAWRIKPKTIRIGELDVPEPVRVALVDGRKYFIPDVSDEDDFSVKLEWTGDNYDKVLLRRGMIHLTQEDAKLHAKALILVSGGKIDD